MGNFQELKVWQRGKDLAVFLYKIIRAGEFGKDRDLRGQMRRAGVSIPSNIAEGDELDTDRQAVKFFYIAKGSCAELLTQVIIARDIGYLVKQDFDHLESECQAISKMLTALIRARATKKNT
ncbi:MAG: four helix bundle protein [Deltaproteobacteria bacterium]|nr:four helix bundle protein [Deltaproteobacteria bacterium]